MVVHRFMKTSERSFGEYFFTKTANHLIFENLFLMMPLRPGSEARRERPRH
jgi:hypothetical protein